MSSYAIFQQPSISCPNSITGDAGVFFLALINTLFTNQCQLGNKDDYPEDVGPSLIDNDIFDYIVVGGGSSGSVVASQLARNKQNRVLVLEAGGFPSPTSDVPAFHLSLQKTVEDWQFHTEPTDQSCLGFKNKRCSWPSGRVLGGSSTINSMIYTRGSKHVYNSWAEDGNLGWSYHEVYPFFKKSEKLEAHELISSKQYGLGGVLPLTRNRNHHVMRNHILGSVKEMGYKVNSHESAPGFFEALQTIHEGVRKNSAKVFLADHKILPNLKVSTEALVEKVLIDAESKEADGVRVNIGGRILNLYAEKEVIISAGPVNSPKLLMLSGIGPKNHLGTLGIETVHDSKVGENLRDSVTYPLFTVKVNSSAIKYAATNPNDELYSYFVKREGALGTTGVNNIVGFLSTKNHSGDANVKFNYHFIPKQDSLYLTQYRRIFNFEDAITKSIAEANKDSNLLVIHITLLDVKSKGKIMLRSKNPHEKPLIYPGYFTVEKDLDTLVDAIKIARKQIETESFKKLGAVLVDVDIPNCRQLQFETEEYWRCAIRNVATTAYSPISSCKMGLSIDPQSVVDPLLRVHGVGKLRVVDTSVIPTSTGGDNGAAAIMIGQKGAQMILEGFHPKKE